MAAVTRLHVWVDHYGHSAYILAAQVGIHRTTLSSYIQGKKPILEPHKQALAYVLGCDPAAVDGWVDTTLLVGVLGASS